MLRGRVKRPGFGAVRRGAPGASCQTATSRSDSGYGNGFSSTPSTTLNTAVVAPIPIASVATTIASVRTMQDFYDRSPKA